jgi:type I restriction enzyme S subunit
MKHTIDLHADHLELIQTILKQHLSGGQRVWIFGSRTTGMAKTYSDVDLVIDAGEPLPLAVMAGLANAFEESSLPYKVDIVDWAAMSESFRDKIDKEKVFLLLI